MELQSYFDHLPVTTEMVDMSEWKRNLFASPELWCRRRLGYMLFLLSDIQTSGWWAKSNWFKETVGYIFYILSMNIARINYHDYDDIVWLPSEFRLRFINFMREFTKISICKRFPNVHVVLPMLIKSHVHVFDRDSN